MREATTLPTVPQLFNIKISTLTLSSLITVAPWNEQWSINWLKLLKNCKMSTEYNVLQTTVSLLDLAAPPLSLNSVRFIRHGNYAFAATLNKSKHLL